MSLSKEILEGKIDGVKALLEQGTIVNTVDEYGCTPLIHAAATNRNDIAALLMQYNANPDLVDRTGSSALHWAIDNNNFDMVELFLHYKANPNSYTSNGQPALFYPLLRRNKELVKLLLDNGADLNFAKDFIMAKLIGHRFELQGNSDIVTPQGLFIGVDLEGFYLEFTLSIIRESLEKFINSYMAHRMDIHSDELKVIIAAYLNASQLREFKHFSVDIESNKQTIYHFMEKDLLLLPVSYKGHAINFIKHGKFLAKCDRGVQKMTDPIVINQIGLPQKLNHEFYLNLLYGKHTEKFIKVDLVKLLGLQSYAKLPIKHQITGNCSWANTESAVPTMLYMLLHDKLKDESDQAKVEALVDEIMRFYQAWLEWDKDRAIEDCLEDFEKMSFQRQKARAALLGAVLFQACNPNKPTDVARAQKILTILSRKEFQYIVRIYATVFVRGRRSSYGNAYQRLIEMCGFQLSQFNY
ncbi:MAG: ankyrin repeat domain-containing protein [Candidatus Berkiellales bacterium]